MNMKRSHSCRSAVVCCSPRLHFGVRNPPWRCRLASHLSVAVWAAVVQPDNTLHWHSVKRNNPKCVTTTSECHWLIDLEGLDSGRVTSCKWYYWIVKCLSFSKRFLFLLTALIINILKILSWNEVFFFPRSLSQHLEYFSSFNWHQ